MTSSAAMNIYFLHGQNLPFLWYIHCYFCLNLHITHGDMEENVSGCFFLNTVYIALTWPVAYTCIRLGKWLR